MKARTIGGLATLCSALLFVGCSIYGPLDNPNDPYATIHAILPGTTFV